MICNYCHRNTATVSVDFKDTFDAPTTMNDVHVCWECLEALSNDDEVDVTRAESLSSIRRATAVDRNDARNARLAAQGSTTARALAY